MNRIKRTSAIILAFLLIIVVAFQQSVGGVFGNKDGKFIDSLFKFNQNELQTIIGSSDYIYFDLAAGKITFSNGKYSGYVFVNGEVKPVTGNHDNTNKYYVFQSNTNNAESINYKSKTGYENDTDYTNKTNCRIPQYERVSFEGQYWADYTVNRTNVEEVSKNWDIAAPNVGRNATENYLDIQKSAAGKKYDITVDNLWTTYYQKISNSINTYESRTTGGLGAHLNSNTDTTIKFKLKGDNRFNNVHYNANKGTRNTITFCNGEEGSSKQGSMTVCAYQTHFASNHWCSVIGGADNNGTDKSDGIIIDSGYIYAGSTWKDNCTALGGGGNEYGKVTINNGTVTAVAATTGTAIGGGIGFGSPGGDAEVTINDGEIYAYNFGVEPKDGLNNSYDKYVPAVAIGGGSSKNQSGNKNTTVTINGGKVYAQSKGGAAIGGGGSSLQYGGGATININGGEIIAKSVEGAFGSTRITPGASIGGGTGGKGGGSVVLNITGGVLRTGSIGGGKTTGTGNIGSASVNISGGDIVGQVIMAAGSSTNCKFTMSGGTIHDVNVMRGMWIDDIEDPDIDENPLSFVEQNGGAVWMDDPKGETKITGGTIRNCLALNGGAVYMTQGTYTISNDAVLLNNVAVDNGGGVYVGGGSVNVNGGEITKNVAEDNGGAFYVGDGIVNVTGGSINGNLARINGGAIYVSGNYNMSGGEVLSNKATNGGGINVVDGSVTMYGGDVNSNVATDMGGGMYVSSSAEYSLVDIMSGSISGNQARAGAGITVDSISDKNIDITIGVNCVHPDLNATSRDRTYTAFDYPTEAIDYGEAHETHTNHMSGLKHTTCPKVDNNIASEIGGGFYLKSPNSKLTLYCLESLGNKANGNPRCFDMDVNGGHVEIGDKSYDHTTSNPVKGNIIMQNSILVQAGTVDVYGIMINPQFTDDVTVDIKKDGDYYLDHRYDDDPTNNDYKVHYYENFKGEGDTPTGLYIARQYPDLAHENDPTDGKYDFTVMSSIFVHEGYRIVEWNTKPDRSGETYEVNATYNLLQLDNQGKLNGINSHGNADEDLLVIYAIWERCGYVIEFNPNVSKTESYTGSMENQRVTVGVLDGSQRLDINQFKRPGYKFVGWSLTPEQGEKIYLDGQEIREDFTTVDGEIITLYAIWEPCDHVDYLVYKANGNVLTEECSMCGAHKASATITTVNSVYDGNEHLGSLTYSKNWIGVKPDLEYEMAISEAWDDKDEFDEEWQTNHKPIHAGSYTASLTVEGVTAQSQYEITPIKWSTLENPIVEFGVADGKGIITIINPQPESNIQYWVKLIDDTGEHPLVDYQDWQNDNHFHNILFGHYYYFYAKRIADRNHLESDPSRSEAYLSTGGNIVVIEKGIGIKVDSHFGEGNFEYIVSADDGYHLRNYSDNADPSKADYALNSIEQLDPSGVYNPGSITLTKDDTNASSGVYKYSVHFEDDQVSYHKVTLKFNGAVKNASVSSKYIDGQVFNDFNSSSALISKDSAFTAQFKVYDYIPSEYAAQNLVFANNIPEKSTIIMKANNQYWYYNVSTPVDSINLTEFIKMGDTTKYEYDLASDAPTSLAYQFIVDFSQVEKDKRLDLVSLGISLGLSAKPSLDSNAPSRPSIFTSDLYVSIADVARFSIAPEAIKDKTTTIDCTYDASVGKASIWNNRNSALVITAPASAPKDLAIAVVVEGKNSTYSMNANRQFIIQLGNIGTKKAKITLDSKMFTLTDSTLQLNVDWYISASSASVSPLNGVKVASCIVDFSGKKSPVPSIRIDGTNFHYHQGEVLNVTINYLGIPDNGTVTAYLQAKNGNQFVDTGAKVESIKDDTLQSKPISFNMGEMAPGSYRVLVAVQVSGGTILKVPYYFVIS